MKKNIPDDIIIFISGVPGVGKTTISYELLHKCQDFRIVQETDIIREILRGYNEFLINNLTCEKDLLPNIFAHDKLLSYDEAKNQCKIMGYPIQQIVCRQRRKKIPTIINGVHIIPEVLSTFICDDHSKYINLYFENEDMLYQRLRSRDENKYSKSNIPYLFAMNNDLQKNMEELHAKNTKTFMSIKVDRKDINEIMDAIISFIEI